MLCPHHRAYWKAVRGRCFCTPNLSVYIILWPTHLSLLIYQQHAGSTRTAPLSTFLVIKMRNHRVLPLLLCLAVLFTGHVVQAEEPGACPGDDGKYRTTSAGKYCSLIVCCQSYICFMQHPISIFLEWFPFCDFFAWTVVSMKLSLTVFYPA